jgi:hypothetical protein
MKVNIENAAATGSPKTKAWLLDELVKNLKELRDRTEAGDMSAIDEFFDLFKFNDSEKAGGSA